MSNVSIVLELQGFCKKVLRCASAQIPDGGIAGGTPQHGVGCTCDGNVSMDRNGVDFAVNLVLSLSSEHLALLVIVV